MAPTPRRSAPAKPRTAIPQLSWRDPQPAPIVLISGPEEVCAERATFAVREYLRAEDPSLEVSDVRADDYAQGTLLAVTSPSLSYRLGLGVLRGVPADEAPPWLVYDEPERIVWFTTKPRATYGVKAAEQWAMR